MAERKIVTLPNPVLRRRKQEAEAARERERIAEAITMYHRNVEDMQQRRGPLGRG